MHAPLISTITLCAELLVSAIIYYSLYQGYKKDKFPTRLAFGALAYEIIFNISYMVSKVSDNAMATKVEAPATVFLAITHGILSLVMFIALIIFFVFAWKSYRKEINFFRKHKNLTIAFTFFWTLSILSGTLFYLALYVF